MSGRVRAVTPDEAVIGLLDAEREADDWRHACYLRYQRLVSPTIMDAAEQIMKIAEEKVDGDRPEAMVVFLQIILRAHAATFCMIPANFAVELPPDIREEFAADCVEAYVADIKKRMPDYIAALPKEDGQ